jgi:hypothetical protein
MRRYVLPVPYTRSGQSGVSEWLRESQKKCCGIIAELADPGRAEGGRGGSMETDPHIGRRWDLSFGKENVWTPSPPVVIFPKATFEEMTAASICSGF